MMRKRSEEREQAFCLLFQSLFNTDENFEIYEENIESVGDYARSIALGVEEKKDNLDGLIEKYSKGWKVKRLPKVNLAILRLAAYEILFVDDVPESVAINEAVELAKKYSGESDYSFVNGVLGALVKGEVKE